MPTVKIRAKVLICPHRDHRRIPAQSPALSTWPSPAKAEVVLTKARIKPTMLGETDDNGVTSLSNDLQHGTYKVAIRGYDGFVAEDLTVTAAHDQKTVEIRLFPLGDYCLVPLLLTEQPTGIPADGATVVITSSDGVFEETFKSGTDGRVYAYAPAGDVTLKFDPMEPPAGQRRVSSTEEIRYDVAPSDIVQIIPVDYWPAIQVSVEPTVKTPDKGTVPLTGAGVTVEYRGSARFAPSLRDNRLDPPPDTISFEYPFPGIYVATITPPAAFGGWPITDPKAQVEARALVSGELWKVPAEFEIATTKPIDFVVRTPQRRPLDADLQLEVYAGDADGAPIAVRVAKAGKDTVAVPAGIPLTIRLAQGTTPKAADIPLKMSTPSQAVVGPPDINNIELELEYENSITGRAIDEHGRTVPGAVIDVFDEERNPIHTVVANDHGSFVVGLQKSGTYFLAPHSGGGEVETFERVEVSSPAHHDVRVRTGAERGERDGEALTDLAAYPVLTEEISTTGVPAPSAGGPGAGYGQTVDQVMRDVLGWRPSGDVAGFRAALTGAFSLREVEGHTEWSWQQRGYAVQADMGALTGAQASIYARAKNALDQIQPLLAGLTTINPALFPQQDLEAIRTVVSTELQELVSELALEGGPRIQRVDELFALLLGAARNDTNLDPDQVDGQLGTLRDRFGLTVDLVNTVDEERIVTNFRVIVEQILSLFASWVTDRSLFSGLTSKTSFGTVLILLSRALEAVGESVDELTFALDSVFVDAAQRQVIVLRFAGLLVNVPSLPLSAGGDTQVTFGADEPPILLSDLLDWVLRASRDEGRKIIQDAGKDGVVAFAPVLDKLRVLVHATQKLSHEHGALPAGLRTPRVRRALREVAGQLDEATDLARSVQRQEPPEISAALEFHSGGGTFAPLHRAPAQGTVFIALLGRNFRDGATAALTAAGRPDLGEVRGHVILGGPSLAQASFADPRTPGDGITWLVSLTNSDGTHSNEVEALRPTPKS